MHLEKRAGFATTQLCAVFSPLQGPKSPARVVLQFLVPCALPSMSVSDSGSDGGMMPAFHQTPHRGGQVPGRIPKGAFPSPVLMQVICFQKELLAMNNSTKIPGKDRLLLTLPYPGANLSLSILKIKHGHPQELGGSVKFCPPQGAGRLWGSRRHLPSV